MRNLKSDPIYPVLTSVLLIIRALRDRQKVSMQANRHRVTSAKKAALTAKKAGSERKATVPSTEKKLVPFQPVPLAKTTYSSR